MFSLKKLWQQWLANDEAEETPGRGNDYGGRQEPDLDVRPGEPSREAAPEGDLPDHTLWTPRLLTV